MTDNIEQPEVEQQDTVIDVQEQEQSHADTQEETTNEPDHQEPEERKEDDPEWFMKDKYKSIEEQARAGYELQKKMGKFWGAPKENYSIENIEGIAKDDPLVENLIPALKDMGISQEGFAHLVKQYQDANVAMMKKYEEELKQELTVNDAKTYQEVNQWMTENLSKEEIESVQNNWLMTPTDFKVFNKLRLMAAPSTNVPSTSNNQATHFETSREVENEKIKYKKEIKQGLRVEDKNFEDELQKRFVTARQRELNGR